VTRRAGQVVEASDLDAAYRMHRDTILSYLRRRTGNATLAEDLTQDVFLAALRAQSRLVNSTEPLLPWLYTVAERRAIDAARRARRAEIERRAETSPHGDADDVSAKTITEALRLLPEEQRRLVLLRLVTGRPFAEIGKALNVDPAVCRVRFSRALRALRESLGAAAALAYAGCQLADASVEAILGCI
jgi:RNA polymerase sigma-70 factor (ECF subfamily)